MITFFKDDMQKTVYTDAFLNNTKYYDNIGNIHDMIDSINLYYRKTKNIDEDLIHKVLVEWNRYAMTRAYMCKPICDFFFIGDNEVRYEFKRIGKKYGIPSYGDEKLLTHLYDIQRNIKSAGVKNISKKQLLDKNFSFKIENNTSLNQRYVIKIIDGDKSSRYIIVKFKNSIGVYDTIEYKMVAYKNFKDNKSYGDWDDKLEKYVLAIYNKAISNIEKSAKSKIKTTEDKAEKHLIKDTQPVITRYSKSLLDSKLTIMAQTHKMDALEIRKDAYSNLTDDIIKLLNKYEECNDIAEFEKLARQLYKESFIRIISYKDISTYKISKEAVEFYEKVTGIRLGKQRDREYRQPVRRGVLINSRGDTLDGGDNKLNQTQISIKMNDDDFCKLCNMFGFNSINQSDLNSIVEQVLYSKFDSNNQYTLSNKAKLAVLYHRDKEAQSKIREFKTCYIPSEYNKYITEIQKANYKTENFKNSKTFVLSTILHEYIGYI